MLPIIIFAGVLFWYFVSTALISARNHDKFCLSTTTTVKRPSCPLLGFKHFSGNRVQVIERNTNSCITRRPTFKGDDTT